MDLRSQFLLWTERVEEWPKHSLSHYAGASNNSPIQGRRGQRRDSEIDSRVIAVAYEPGGRQSGPGDDPLQESLPLQSGLRNGDVEPATTRHA